MDRKLRLLVCTANLGNAQPDLDSLSAWIPPDGACNDTIRSPTAYPLSHDLGRKNDFPQEKEVETMIPVYKDMDQFDIIVIGMQEATFDPPSMSASGTDGTTGIVADGLGKPLRGRFDSVNSQQTELTMNGEGGADDVDEEQQDNERKKEAIRQQQADVEVELEGLTDLLSVSANGYNNNEEDITATQATDDEESKRLNRIIKVKIPKVRPLLLHKGIKKTFTTVSTLTVDRNYKKANSLISESTILQDQDVSESPATPIVPQRSGLKAGVHRMLSLSISDWMGGTTFLHNLLQDHLPSYHHLVSYQRGEMRLEIFVRMAQVVLLPRNSSTSSNNSSCNNANMSSSAPAANMPVTLLSPATNDLVCDGNVQEGVQSLHPSSEDVTHHGNEQEQQQATLANRTKRVTLITNDDDMQPGGSEDGVDAANTTRITLGVLHRVEVLQVSAQNTGRAGLANKGGICAELLLNGHTRLAIITAHLEAHEGVAKYNTRCTTIADIFAGTKQGIHDVSLTAHYCFVLGDLNFRNDGEHGEIKQHIAQKQWEALNDMDELRQALAKNDCLAGFQTLPCHFPPTFKVLRQPGYDYIDKRKPSYTDRILWKTGHQLENGVQPVLYEPVDDFASSDHKPVRAAFEVSLNQPTKMRPTMAQRQRSFWGMSAVKKKASARNLEYQHRRTRTAFTLGGGNSGTHDNLQAAKGGRASGYRLHLFVSDIHCKIEPERYESARGLPNPYLMLVSSPEDIIRKPPRKWKIIRSALKRAKIFEANKTAANSADIKPISDSGWPSSTKQKQTFDAVWVGDHENIHTEVRTHNEDGGPVDLTGSMLRLTLMDHRDGPGEDVVIGTYCVNLANMVRTCKPPRDQRRRQLSFGTITSVPEDNPRVRNSLMNVLRRMGPSSRSLNAASDADEITNRSENSENSDADPIRNLEINGPLLRNGKIMGQIECVLEAWWMDEWTAHAVSFSAPHNAGRNQHKHHHANPKTKAAIFGSKAADFSFRGWVSKHNRGVTDHASEPEQNDSATAS